VIWAQLTQFSFLFHVSSSRNRKSKSYNYGKLRKLFFDRQDNASITSSLEPRARGLIVPWTKLAKTFTSLPLYFPAKQGHLKKWPRNVFWATIHLSTLLRKQFAVLTALRSILALQRHSCKSLEICIVYFGWNWHLKLPFRSRGLFLVFCKE